MLRGNALAKVDEKGRLKLPAQFRSILVPRFGKEFFVTSILGDCVHVYPVEVYTGIEEKIAGASFVSPKVNKLRRALAYYGQSATIDGQGRILIHPLLREQTGVDGDVCVFGQGDRLMVWDRALVEKDVKDKPLTEADLADLTTFGL